MEKVELRILPTTLTTEDEGMFVEGLVNATDKLSHVLGVRNKFVEKVSKGAFKKALERRKRIDFLAEHDSKMLLATTENGSLTLFEDEEGLKIRAKITPTSYGKDVYMLMKDGMMGHMSFGFKSISDRWEKRSDGLLERTIDDLELFEVSAVRNPAYPQSVISARGIEVVEDVEVPNDIEGEKREMDSKEVETPNEEAKQEQISVEDLRSLVETCKGLVDEVRELIKEKKEVPDEKVEEKVEEERKEDEPEEKPEERKVDLSAYYERLNKIGVKGE